MSKVIAIPNIGNVAFPDGMADEEISRVARKEYQKATIHPVLQALLKDAPEMQGHKTTSEHFNEVAKVSKFLEEHPTLTQLAFLGLRAKRG